jgi:hypothetical protein
MLTFPTTGQPPHVPAGASAAEQNREVHGPSSASGPGELGITIANNPVSGTLKHGGIPPGLADFASGQTRVGANRPESSGSPTVSAVNVTSADIGITNATTNTTQSHSDSTAPNAIASLATMRAQEKEKKDFTSPEKQQEVLNLFKLRQQELDKTNPAERNWTPAMEKFGEIFGRPLEEVRAGAKNAGNIYPFSWGVSQVLLSCTPSLLSAYLPLPSSVAASRLGVSLQGLVAAATPMVNTFVHMAVVPGQEALYNGNIPKLKGVPGMDQANAGVAKAHHELKTAKQSLDEARANPGGNHDIAELENLVNQACKSLEDALSAHDGSIETEKIQVKGQGYQDLGRAARSVLNSAAAFYGIATGDTKTAAIAQTAAMLGTTAYGVWASRKDAVNKMDQQMITMLTLTDFRNEAGKANAPGALTVEHMDCDLLAKQLELPGEIILKHAAEYFKTQKDLLEQSIAGAHGVTLAESRERSTLMSKNQDNSISDSESLRLGEINKKYKEELPSNGKIREQVTKWEGEVNQYKQTLENLKSENFDQIPKEHQKVLEVLVGVQQDKEKTGWNMPFNLAKASSMIGGARQAQVDQGAPMAVQKTTQTMTNMVVGGNATMQMLSAGLREFQNEWRSHSGNPNYELPMAVRATAASVGTVVNFVASQSSPQSHCQQGKFQKRSKRRRCRGQKFLPCRHRQLFAECGLLEKIWTRSRRSHVRLS